MKKTTTYVKQLHRVASMGMTVNKEEKFMTITITIHERVYRWKLAESYSSLIVYGNVLMSTLFSRNINLQGPEF